MFGNAAKRRTPILFASTKPSHFHQHRCSSSSSSSSSTPFTLQQKQHNLALIGPPGSGKGTYGKLLSSRLSSNRFPSNDNKVPLITCSDILKEHIQRKTNVGLLIQDCQKHGRLANDELVGRAVLTHLMDHHHHMDQEEDGEKGFTRIGYILDGFPRTVPQAKMMDNNNDNSSSSSIFWPPSLSITYAISIDVPDQICIDKIRGRRVCTKCHHSYNIAHVDYDGYYMPPTLPKQPCSNTDDLGCYCDVEKNYWTCRHDDLDEEIVKRRIHDFHNETRDVLSYYEERGRLIHFKPYRGVDDMDILEELVLEKIGFL